MRSTVRRLQHVRRLAGSNRSFFVRSATRKEARGAIDSLQKSNMKKAIPPVALVPLEESSTVKRHSNLYPAHKELYFNDLDGMHTNATTPFVFFFPSRLDPQLLRRSLSEALSLYPTLGGRIVQSTAGESIGQVAMSGFDEGVQFDALRTVKKGLSQIVREEFFKFGENPFTAAALYDLTSPSEILSGKSAPLRVRYMESCDEEDELSAVVVSVWHCVTDPIGFFHFMVDWAALASGRATVDSIMAQRPPMIDHSPLNRIADSCMSAPSPVGGFGYTASTWEHLKFLMSYAWESGQGITSRVEHFSESDITALKAKAAVGLKAGEMVSVNDVLAAHVYQCIARARSSKSATTRLFSSTNIRPSLAKAHSSADNIMLRYLGNAMASATAPELDLSVGEAAAQTLGAGALAHRRAVDSLQDSERVKGTLAWLREHRRGDWTSAMGSGPSLGPDFVGEDLLVSPHHFPLDDVDFGAGPPCKFVASAFPALANTALMSPSLDMHKSSTVDGRTTFADGGVDVFVTLKLPTMNKLDLGVDTAL